MVKERKRPLSNPQVNLPSLPIEDTSKLTTQAEDESLNLIYSELTPSQIMAARLEAAGAGDRQLIATQCGVEPTTITSWRKNEKYQSLINLNLAIIDRLSRDSRIAAVKQIIAPAFVELIKRMADPEEMKTTSTKDLLHIITSMNKEIRLDSNFATDKSDDNTLADLQKRRSHLQAEQQLEIERLKKNNKVIEMPMVVNG